MSDHPESSITPKALALPLLALRDVVVYPKMQIALYVGRPKSIQGVEISKAHDDMVFVVAQKDSLSEDITLDNLYTTGTVCRILQVIDHESDDNCIKILIEGLYRAKLDSFQDEGDYLIANSTPLAVRLQFSEEQQQLELTQLRQLFSDYAEAKLRNARELVAAATDITDIVELLYFICTRSPMSLESKQQLLELTDITKTLKSVSDFLGRQITEQEIDSQIQENVKKQMEKNQREYFLNEKMKVIQRELSDMNGGSDDDILDLQQKLEKADLPAEVRKKADSEFRKLKTMQPSSSEASVIRGYIDWILNTPWKVSSDITIDLPKSEQVLNDDHYGLEEVKERILEYLAVQARVGNFKGQIICLVGPPGVGKTSLGESIARATGREFVRMALGGMRDEAEIRGHRRTYIGAMPGKIVQQLAKVGVNNPLFLLDEVDKMGQDSRGDPASALLEVLDPSQNHAFNDHYLDMDLDLSNVMFICTANSMNIPAPLLDRMEVIRLPGYTEDEKYHIAQKYLVPKLKTNAGLKDEELAIDEAAIRDLIRRYTREAGVRNLEREIGKICRKVVAEAVKSKDAATAQVTYDNLADYSGVYKFDYGRAAEKAEVGQVTGLAWTSVGGVILNVEVAAVKGKGTLTLTGSLGNVMQESIKAAMTVVRSRGDELGIDHEEFGKIDVHFHVPEGATPKDGPSAGIAMTTALISAMTKIPVRADVAMTGEINLHGQVLTIGGLKEKLLAAHRAGIKLALVPKENLRELHELPDNIKAGIEIRGVTTIDEVIEAALMEKPKALPTETPPLIKPIENMDNKAIN